MSTLVAPLYAPSLLSGLGAALSHRLAQARSYRATCKELESLSDDDLADLGILRCDIRALAARTAARH